MSHLEKQKELTDGKGWKKVMTDKFKEDIQTVKTKAKNVWGGVKIVADKLKGKE